MLGDTLTVTLDGSGGTAVVCSKINQDAYSSEYLKKRTDDEIRVRVRHSKESAKAGQPVVERHNVEFTQTIYATDDTPEQVIQVYAVIRAPTGADITAVTDLGEALAYWLSDTNLDKLFGWES